MIQHVESINTQLHPKLLEEVEVAGNRQIYIQIVGGRISKVPNIPERTHCIRRKGSLV